MTDRPEKIDLSDVKSRKVDENMLNELRDLFERADEQKERYDFTWNGKAKAYFEAASPSTKTLKPDEKESVDFKNSENLFITGDNLEALKLMQESYLGKIDMIYIDPPYNTGKDFVYHDNFRKNKKDSDLSEGNVDEEGNRLVKNEKSSGRYHSDWLSMMYPRLKISRDLLKDSGSIFVSIGDAEQANLKLLMDEVFGEDNFVYELSVVTSLNGNDNSSGMMETNEYAFIYSKDKEKFDVGVLPIDEGEELLEWNQDEKGYWKVGGSLKATGINAPRSARPKLFYPIWINKETLDFSLTPKNSDEWDKIIPLTNGEEMSWYWSKDKMTRDKDDVIVKKVKDGYSLYKKQRPALGDLPSKRGKTTFYSPKYSTSNSNSLIKKYFNGKKIFDYSKSVDLIKDFISLSNSGDDAIIMDAFAGSGTTADAVMRQNKEDGGNRKFIMVTLDEKTPLDSLAFSNGYKTIDKISKDRIKKAAKTIGDNSGFRALTVSNTNLRDDVFKKSSELQQGQLIMDIDNNSDNRSDYELLYDVLISSAFEYNRPISIDNLDGEKIIKYDYFGELSGVIGYFGENLTDDLIRKIASLKPLVAVFKESTFDKSSQKVNLLEQFRITSPDTKVKVI